MRGSSERIEYLKQPHIIGLLVLVVALVGIALFTGSRRLADINQNANKSTEERCLEYVGDQDLCKFVAAQETSGFSNYVSTTRELIDGQEQITVLEVENPNRLRSTTTKLVAELKAYILLDADNYVKDYSDGMWALYTDPAYVPELGSAMYDLSTASSEDTVLFRDAYKRVGTESCGDVTCHKYEITDSDDPGVTNYVWFDTQSYLIRRQQSIGNGREIDTNYVYTPVSISTPSPVKTVSESEIIKLLE